MKKFSLVPLAGSIALALSAPAMAEQSVELGSHADLGQKVQSERFPAPVRVLLNQGLTFHETFEVKGGLTGYAMSMQGQPVPVFVTADGERAIIGSMIDGEGNDLVHDRLNDIILAPANDAAWEQLESHEVVVEGDADAPNVLYTITDPNCPYCHRQWQNTQALVDAGKLQVRHVLVGMLAEDSATKAAAILQAEDPASALRDHQRNFESGGIAPAEEIDPRTQEVIDQGMELMAAANVSGTPANFYKDDEGSVQRVGGAMRTEDIVERFDIDI